MRRIYITSLIIFSFSVAKAQIPDTLTLDFVQAQAKANYPLIKQNAIIIESNLLKIKNYRANFYPKADLNAQASYQSDVTHVELSAPTIDFNGMFPPGAPKPTITMPAIASPDKDQYKATLDVSQMIYDGGMTKQQIALENAGLGMDTTKTAVDLYQIRERVNQTFFSILLIQEKIQLIKLLQNDLLLKLKLLESTTKNGVTSQSDVLILQAEIIKIDQQLTELTFTKKAALNIISIFINQKLPETIGFKASEQILAKSEITRPETALFLMQKNKIDFSEKILTAKRMPKLYGFAQLGYGKPGLNMFKNEFSDFYIVGAKFSWNIWDWNQNNRERQILTLQKDLIQNQQEAFEKNIQMSCENEIANIDKAEILIQQDKQLIQLREEISKMTFSQVENGMKTMDEYINNTNAELNAKINYQIHQLQAIQAKANYNNLIGK